MSGSVHLRYASLEFSVFAIMSKRIDKFEMLRKMHGQESKYLKFCSLNFFISYSSLITWIPTQISCPKTYIGVLLLLMSL